MHQYLDSDGSGTSPTCVSSTIGAERLANATQWLQDNNLRGFLGEIGAGSNGAAAVSFQLMSKIMLKCWFMKTSALPPSKALCVKCNSPESG